MDAKTSSELTGETISESRGEGSLGLVSPLQAVGILGFGFYLAYFYVMMTCNLLPPSFIGRTSENSLVLVFLLGEACAAGFLGMLAKRLTHQRVLKALSCIAAFALFLPSVAVILSLPLLWFFVCWFASGMGMVCMLSLWGFFLAQLDHKRAVVFPAISALIAGIVLVTNSLLLKADALPYLGIILPLTSAGLFLFWAISLWSRGEFVCPKKTRPYDLGSLLHSAGAMVANSFLLGFCFYVMASSGSPYGWMAISFSIVIAAVYKLLDAAHGLHYQVDMIIKIIAPVAAVTFLLMPYFLMPYRYLLFAACMVFAMIDEVVCWTAVAEYMHIHQVQPFANMAFGRFGDIVGLFLGFSFGAEVLGDTLGQSVNAGLLTGIVVIAFVAIQVFFFKDSYTPFVEHKTMTEECAQNVEGCNRGNFVSDSPRVGAWKRRCELFADHYQLTARQTEVLILLAKGYSTAKIEEELVVTNHTVKAHIYGIYQKTDVHSRQELIDLLEDFPTEENFGEMSCSPV